MLWSGLSSTRQICKPQDVATSFITDWFEIVFQYYIKHSITFYYFDYDFQLIRKQLNASELSAPQLRLLCSHFHQKLSLFIRRWLGLCCLLWDGLRNWERREWWIDHLSICPVLQDVIKPSCSGFLWSGVKLDYCHFHAHNHYHYLLSLSLY